MVNEILPNQWGNKNIEHKKISINKNFVNTPILIFVICSLEWLGMEEDCNNYFKNIDQCPLISY